MSKLILYNLIPSQLRVSEMSVVNYIQNKREVRYIQERIFIFMSYLRLRKWVIIKHVVLCFPLLAELLIF